MIAAEVTGIFAPKTDARRAPGSTTRASAAPVDPRHGPRAAMSTASASSRRRPTARLRTRRFRFRCATPGATTSTRAASTRARSTASIPTCASSTRASGSRRSASGSGPAYAPDFPRCSPTYRSDRDAAAAVIAIGAVGLLALALAVVALLGGLAANRRGESIALVRSRGGASWQVLGAEAVEGIAVALPAGLLGYAARPPARRRPQRRASAAARARRSSLATGAILAAAAASAPRAADSPPAGATRWRCTRCLAAPARRRGGDRRSPRSSGSTSCGGAVSRTRTASTHISRRCRCSLGLAAGILAVRLYPLPVRFLAAAAARRRDLVPALALRRVARQPGVTAAPLLVLLLGVSVSVFAAVMAATLSDAQEGAEPGRSSRRSRPGRSTRSGQEPCSRRPTLPS